MNKKEEFSVLDLYEVTSKAKASSITRTLREVITYRVGRISQNNFNQVMYFNLDDAIKYFMRELPDHVKRHQARRDETLRILHLVKENKV